MIKHLFEKYIIVKADHHLSLSIILPMLLLIIGSLTILYASNSDDGGFPIFFVKQMQWFFISIIVFFMTQHIRIRFYYEFAYFLLFLLVILIFLTYFTPSISGSHRWLIFGSLKFQPSELGKLVIVFSVAKLLTDIRDGFSLNKLIAITFLICSIPALIVFRQPDLGTALVYIFVAIPMLLWRGIRPFHLFILFAPLVSTLMAYNLTLFSMWMVIVASVLYFSQPGASKIVGLFSLNVIFGAISTLIWSNLYPHQQKRILTFLNPMNDPSGAGYQIIQSKTAIGSGGLLGVGLGQGTQTQLKFLPVRNSDFIISVIGEELGFIGITSIFILFVILIYWMINYAYKTRNQFSSLVIVGFASMIFFHVFVNMAMAVGMLPVTGLPLPFVSYGGTFLVSMIIALGISQNIINSNY